MKWFYKWLLDKLNSVQRNYTEDTGPGPPSNSNYTRASISSRLTNSRESSRYNFEQRPLTFKVYTANGGYAVEYTLYNEQKEEIDHQLHVIPIDANIAESIGKIVEYQLMVK